MYASGEQWYETLAIHIETSQAATTSGQQWYETL